jgi:hypothetical protein
MSDAAYEHQEQHEMELLATHPNGADEWYCPTCGRRFLMYWPPNYEKIILEVGDEFAVHSGVKGGPGLELQSPQAAPHEGRPEEEPVMSEELRAALEEVLEDIDFDDWPDAAE